MTLRVTLEIVPFGQEDKKYTIETINISNTGFFDDNGTVYIIEHNEYKTDKPFDEKLKTQHKRQEGALELAKKALEKILQK